MNKPTDSKAAPKVAREVTCPTCKRPALFTPENAWRPFCSQRCRGEDLGAWASEQFRVAAPGEVNADGVMGADGAPAAPHTSGGSSQTH
jgi:uncharacterized protein